MFIYLYSFFFSVFPVQFVILFAYNLCKNINRKFNRKIVCPKNLCFYVTLVTKFFPLIKLQCCFHTIQFGRHSDVTMSRRLITIVQIDDVI